MADLALILVATRVMGHVAAAVNQPRVVGEIVAGILIGPTVLGGHVGIGAIAGSGLVDRLYPPKAYDFLHLTGQIGLVLYLFLVGIEVDRILLQGRRRPILLVAVATSAAPIALGFGAASLFAGPTWRPSGVGHATFSLFLAAGLTATALPVLARLLQEKALIATPVGVTTIGVSSLVTVVTFLLVGVARTSAGSGSVATAVAIRVGLTAALLVVLLVVVRPMLALVIARVDVQLHAGSVVTGLLALALASGLAADRIGVNALIGGFLCGLTVPATRELTDAVIAHLKDVVVLVFLPVFFAVSGLVTDLRSLEVRMLPGLLVYLALLVAGKWVPAYVAGRVSGLAAPEAHIVGALLTCGGVLVLVVGLLGLELGVITHELQAAFAIGALVSLMVAGPLVDRYVRARVLVTSAGS